MNNLEKMLNPFIDYLYNMEFKEYYRGKSKDKKVNMLEYTKCENYKKWHEVKENLKEDIKYALYELFWLDLVKIKEDELPEERKKEILNDLSDCKESIQKNMKILLDWIDETQEELKQ